MATFTDWIERDGKDIPVFVEYIFNRPRRATQFEPAEGGVEIERVVCDVELTKQEKDNAEQRCIDAAWDEYYGR